MKSNDDEWITVSRNNKKRSIPAKLSKAKAKSAKLKKNAIIESHIGEDTLSRVEITLQVQKTLRAFEQTDFYLSCLVPLFQEGEGIKRKFQDIVCYGIGTFSSSKASLWQLVCALSLKKLLDITSIHYYEPFMTQVESDVLQHDFGVQIIAKNERGCRSISNGEKATLFFMPHCPQMLYHNVLFTNWNSLRNVFVVGNSFSGYALNQIGKTSATITALLPHHIQEVPLRYSSKDIATHAGFENAFNDTSWTCITNIDGKELPPRPENISDPEIDNSEVI